MTTNCCGSPSKHCCDTLVWTKVVERLNDIDIPRAIPLACLKTELVTYGQGFWILIKARTRYRNLYRTTYICKESLFTFFYDMTMKPMILQVSCLSLYNTLVHLQQDSRPLKTSQSVKVPYTAYP